MSDEPAVLPAPATVVLDNVAGLRAEALEHGALARLEAHGRSLLLHPASTAEAGLANVYLRVHDAGGHDAGGHVRAHALLGPASGSEVVLHGLDGGAVTATGDVAGVSYRLTLRLGRAEATWHWELHLTNTTRMPLTVDSVLTHDPALAPMGAVRNNEYYVSQYLDISPVTTAACGTAVAVRQNMPGEKAPWLMVGSVRRGVGWSTDALQLVERTPAGVLWSGLAVATLPSRRLQHEHSLIALQDEPVTLAPGATHRTGFWGIALDDHPEATSDADALWAERALGDAPPADGVPDDGAASGRTAVATLPATALVLAARPLTREELAEADLLEGRTLVEADSAGAEVAWMVRGGQFVTAAKELIVLRPHGHLLRTGDALTPDTRSLTTTVWMAGTFLSQVTRGHVGRHPVVTGRRTYLGLQRAHGVRLFVEDADGTGWSLLETPSGWFTGLDHCTWWYAAHDGAVLTVTSRAPADRHELTLSWVWTGGVPRRVLLAAQLADDLTDPPRIDVVDAGVHVLAAGDDRAWRFAWPGAVASAQRGDARLQADGVARSAGWFTVAFEEQDTVTLSVTADEHESTAPDEHELRPETHLGAGFWDATAHAISLTLTLPPTLPPTHPSNRRKATNGGSAPVERPRSGPADGPGSPVRGLSTVEEAGVGTGTEEVAVAGQVEVAVAGQVEALSAALPWFAHNALVHYLSPRGLEQFSGGGWGTRDVCQGPVGLLTALGDQASVRDVLLRVFRAQNARGDWPQAFDFVPPLASAGQQDSHGDVVFWPVLAAGDYLRASGDASILTETRPFVGDAGLTDEATVAEHLNRAVRRIAGCSVPGSPLPAYGHGDWNDSLQPADPRLAAHLVSTWTAVLQTQALRTLAEGLRAVEAAGPPDLRDLAADAADLADRTHEALRTQLDRDPVLPGYLLHTDEGAVEPLVHPSDDRTGLRYGVLPWIHAISADLLTPEQARHHLDLIGEHLLGPDGARLFDRPVGYVGGPMTVFQRAEASTFWGREIGLMYMHAHLRYAEALARVGEGAQLLRALAQASPVDIGTLVRQARPRQSTCYYSSSDAAFTDRYDAQRRYAALLAGEVPLEGGWRVYSSGPGLVLRLVTEVMLGFRARGAEVEIDPVLPPDADGLRATLPVGGRRADVTYRVGELGYGVARVTVGGRDLPVRPLDNPYRRPGVKVSLDDLTPVTRPAPDAALDARPGPAAYELEITVETH